MLDVMVDIETMGNSPTAAILSIGAVAFNTAKIDSHTMYIDVRLQSSVELGGTLDADTVLWWLGQSEEARAALQARGRMGIEQALHEFNSFLRHFGGAKEIRVWGNGASFDNTIIREAMKRCKIEPAWQFYNDRCFRTFKAMHGSVVYEKPKRAHHALADAASQAFHVVKVCKLTGQALA